MKRPRNSYPRTVPRRLAGLGPVPTIPAEWMAGSSTTLQPNYRGMTEESAQCAVEQLRPMNFTRAENVLLAMLAGGVIGYFIGKEK